MSRPHLTAEDRADVFRGLANRLRRRLVDHLRRGPATFDDLQRLAPVAQGTLSSHLTILRDSGLIETRLVDGQMTYRLIPKSLGRVARWAGVDLARRAS